MSSNLLSSQQSVLFLDQGSQLEELIRGGILSCSCMVGFCMGGKQEALSRILKDPPDLLVTSMALLDGTAAELLREIHEKVGTIPSIFIAEPGEIQPFQKAGAFDLIQRPFGVDELVQRVNRAVNATHQFRKKSRLESFVEYSKVHEESVSRGLLVGELLDLKK